MNQSIVLQIISQKNFCANSYAINIRCAILKLLFSHGDLLTHLDPSAFWVQTLSSDKCWGPVFCHPFLPCLYSQALLLDVRGKTLLKCFPWRTQFLPSQWDWRLLSYGLGAGSSMTEQMLPEASVKFWN